mgnify:CR=1 FL=1
MPYVTVWLPVAGPQTNAGRRASIGLPVATEQERTLSRSAAAAQLSTPAGSELVRQRDGNRSEHPDVLVLQRGEPREVHGADVGAVAAEVAARVGVVLGFPHAEGAGADGDLSVTGGRGLPSAAVG